ncbi:MAG: glycosyltransferase, partial [Lysobacterales bacterium]
MTTPPTPPETDAPTGTAAGLAAGGMANARAPSLGAILLDRRQREPGRPLLVLATGLTPSPRVSAALHSLLEALLVGAESPLVLTVLSNAAAEFNPWSGLAPTRHAPPDAPSAVPADIPSDLPADMLSPALTEGLAALLGPGEVHEWPAWPGHAALLSAAAVDLLARADTTAANAPDRLRAAGGRILVADSLFLHDPRRGLFDRAALEPHEQRSPPPWGGLTERLDDWLRNAALDDPALTADLERFAAAPAAGAPTLHVTHSWGGGVARWVESFIDADADGTHFQLCAEGPESGKGCGQRLSLYFGNRLATPVARWWLQPPIRSSTERHPAYRAILDGLLARYGIGRIVVSSLVGHSLDALATGRPTLQVLHDYFPRWPLLGIHPLPYLRADGAVDLERATGEHPLLPEFRDHDAAGWLALGERWRETVQARGVRLVAPSHSVVDLLRRLDPAWADSAVEVIPHGLPPLPGTAEVLPRARADGRLRIVVPGRIQEGKGQQLLLAALPELTRHARVCLLGAGKAGEVFFGQPGVDVVIQYRRDELRSLLATIGPHVAALLSIVPETFSFTLSEMQQLGIPVIATRVGSLAERIVDDETGWLIEPDARALVDRVRELAADPARIERVRRRLGQLEPQEARHMVQRYAALLAPRDGRRDIARPAAPAAAQLSALAFQNRELGALNRQLAARAAALQDEVDERTEWAEERERARQAEEDLRVRWVVELERQLDERFAELQAARDAFDHEKAQHAETRESVRNLESMLQRLQAEHAWVLASRSWRATRPFRVAGRVWSNLGRAGAWNPARWPLLLSQASRTLRTRGLRGALLRAQREQQHFTPRALDPHSVEAIGDPGAPERLPRAEQPDVSIVIPVHNKWVYTAACLRSLAETAGRASFEVIVVDDQSSDETPANLARIEGLLCLRNEQNLGFVGSCNRGAEAARGRYVLMLNNDTQVLDGWLDALLGTFERHPQTGLAGARLVYPDGSLQEAGGIVFSDGSGWNYGRGDIAERPEYQYSRAVDYCSGSTRTSRPAARTRKARSVSS